MIKANNSERNLIATFFYGNNKMLKLTDRFGAALAATLFVNGLISIAARTDQPIVWTIVMVISGIAMASVTSNSIHQNVVLAGGDASTISRLATERCA